jgi:prophage antirepressor-like protein
MMQLKKHVDEDEKQNLENLNSRPLDCRGLDKYEKKTIYINESGVYSLVLKSKMKEAKIFKKWLTSEVLPSIRKRREYKIKQLSIEFEQKLSIMHFRI